jgi:hypothetical protein
MGITQSVFTFLALDIQHKMRERHIIICGLPRFATFFPHYLIKARFSKNLLNTKCVSLQVLSETFFILRRSKPDTIKNVYRSVRKVPVVFVRF